MANHHFKWKKIRKKGQGTLIAIFFIALLFCNMKI